jgi:hypothetical protein
MRLACEHIRDRVRGWDKPDMATAPHFAFACWLTHFTELREELRGIAAAKAKPVPLELQIRDLKNLPK